MEITLIILAVLLGVVGFLVFRAYMRMKSIKSTPESANIKNLTDQNFKQQTKQGLVLVDFWAEWCMPCKLMVPILNELAEDDELKVEVTKLNVDEAKATAGRYGIRSIPTSILFKNGKEVQRFVGVKSTDQFRKQILKYMNK
jgi:thioredoxin 1